VRRLVQDVLLRLATEFTDRFSRVRRTIPGDCLASMLRSDLACRCECG